MRKIYKEFQEIKTKANFNVLIECPISLSLRIRRIMMKIRTCMSKYSLHIAALKPDSKSQDMPRMTYNELRFDITPDPQAEIEKVDINFKDKYKINIILPIC